MGTPSKLQLQSPLHLTFSWKLILFQIERIKNIRAKGEDRNQGNPDRPLRFYHFYWLLINLPGSNPAICQKRNKQRATINSNLIEEKTICLHSCGHLGKSIYCFLETIITRWCELSFAFSNLDAFGLIFTPLSVAEGAVCYSRGQNSWKLRPRRKIGAKFEVGDSHTVTWSDAP